MADVVIVHFAEGWYGLYIDGRLVDQHEEYTIVEQALREAGVRWVEVERQDVRRAVYRGGNRVPYDLPLSEVERLNSTPDYVLEWAKAAGVPA